MRIRNCRARRSHQGAEQTLREVSLAKAKIKPRTSTSPGTSPSPATRTSPSGCSTSATTHSRSSATRTSATSPCRATSPQFTVDTVDRVHTPAEGAGDGAPPGPGHLPGPLLPEPGLRAWRPLRARRRTGCRARTAPGPRTSTASIPQAARGRRGAAAAPAAALRARAARERQRGDLGRRSRPSGRRTTSSSAPPTRSGSPTSDVPNIARASSRTSANFPELTDRVQQGLLRRALPRAADDPPERLRLERPRLPRRRRRRLGSPSDDRHARGSTTTATARAGSWAGR